MAITLFVEPRFVSPYVCSCMVTLTEKDLAFDVRVLDADAGETRGADYLANTITGRVPTLQHDDFFVAESSAILEYLEDAFPAKRVFPSNVRDRARARQLMSWMRSDDTALIREERSTMTIFHKRADKPLSPNAQTQATKLVAVAERLIRDGQPNLFGEWSVVDTELAFLLHRLIVNDDPIADRVRNWAAHQWKRPSVAAYVSRPRPNL